MENKIELSDIIIMKKPHACGSNRWEVVRLGVDLKLRCQGCGHEIMMDRLEVYKKMKKKEENKNEKISD